MGCQDSPHCLPQHRCERSVKLVSCRRAADDGLGGHVTAPGTRPEGRGALDDFTRLPGGAARRSRLHACPPARPAADSTGGLGALCSSAGKALLLQAASYRSNQSGSRIPARLV